MAEQMSVQVRQAGDRAAGGTEAARVDSAEVGEGAPVEMPIPQVVSAPGIDAASPIVRTEVIPPSVVGGNGLGVKSGTGAVPSRKRGYSSLLLCGYVSVVLGFALVFVVPRFKSELGGKGLLLVCSVLLAFGAVAVVLGFVRDTIRRL
jgi:hypothetical protein